MSTVAVAPAGVPARRRLKDRLASRGMEAHTCPIVVQDSPHSKAVGSRVKRFVVTTDALDRDKDIVLPSGVDLSEFLTNPVMLWAHKFDQPPIAKAVGAERHGEIIVIDFEFFDDGPNGFATYVFRQYDEGFLNAVSIGFRIVQAGPPDSSIFQRRPVDARECKRVIYSCVLLEVSAVPVGSNPQALQVHKGLITPDDIEDFLIIQEKTMAENPVQRVVGWISKSLGWSSDRIDGLTVKEITALAAVVPPEAETPPTEAKSEEPPAKTTEAKDMPTQTASGDSVCPKCGKGKAECKCGAPTTKDPGDDGGDDVEKCAKCGCQKSACKCGSKSETPTNESKSIADIDMKAVEAMADRIVSRLLQEGGLDAISKGIGEAVAKTIQEQTEVAQGKVS